MFCFANQCTFPHWLWIPWSPFMGLFHLRYKAAGSLHMHTTCYGILSISRWLPVARTPRHWIFLRCALHVTPEPFQKCSSDSWPWNAIHSCGRLSLSPAFLSAPPGWEAVNTTTAERENHSFLPTPLYQCAPSSHRTNPGQTAIKTSAPPAKGWVRVNHRSINLIFIHSPLAASHRWAGSGGVDCVDCHARCNYTHLCLWVALRMTGKNWAVILVILSLTKELAR